MLRSLGWEDPLEEEIATLFSILTWRIHRQRSLEGHKESDMTERGLSVMKGVFQSLWPLGSQRVRHDWKHAGTNTPQLIESMGYMVWMSTTNWHLPRAFARDLTTTTTKLFVIFLCGEWTLCYCSCWLQHLLWRVQGEVRHSVLQGMWWNRSSDRYFQEPISWSQSLHLFISRKALNPFMLTSAPCEDQKTCKVSAWLHWNPPSPKSYILTFPQCLFGAIFQSYLRCYLPAAVLIFPQIKLNLQLSPYTSF